MPRLRFVRCVFFWWRVAWGLVRERTFPRADLAGIGAPGVHLAEAVLDHAYLAVADLRGGYLQGIRLHGANLRGADLRGCRRSLKNNPLAIGGF